MAARTKKEQTHPGTGHTCGECARGRWNLTSFNYLGKPFLIYCEKSTYAYSQREKCNSCYDATPACAAFIAGEKGGAK